MQNIVQNNLQKFQKFYAANKLIYRKVQAYVEATIQIADIVTDFLALQFYYAEGQMFYFRCLLGIIIGERITQQLINLPSTVGKKNKIIIFFLNFVYLDNWFILRKDSKEFDRNAQDDSKFVLVSLKKLIEFYIEALPSTFLVIHSFFWLQEAEPILILSIAISIISIVYSNAEFYAIGFKKWIHNRIDIQFLHFLFMLIPITLENCAFIFLWGIFSEDSRPMGIFYQFMFNYTIGFFLGIRNLKDVNQLIVQSNGKKKWRVGAYLSCFATIIIGTPFAMQFSPRYFYSGIKDVDKYFLKLKEKKLGVIYMNRFSLRLVTIVRMLNILFMISYSIYVDSYNQPLFYISACFGIIVCVINIIVFVRFLKIEQDQDLLNEVREEIEYLRSKETSGKYYEKRIEMEAKQEEAKEQNENDKNTMMAQQDESHLVDTLHKTVNNGDIQQGQGVVRIQPQIQLDQTQVHLKSDNFMNKEDNLQE